MTQEPGAADRRPRHPIRVVARRTGVSLHVLRAWERRYGVVEPARSAGGQRLYSDADIARLTLLRRAVEAGWSISQAAGLEEAELERAVSEAAPGSPPAEGPRSASNGGPPVQSDGEPAGYVAACLEAALRLDHEALRRVLMRAVLGLRPGDFLEQVIGPLLAEVGERWHRGLLRPAHEHAVSVSVRGVLEFLLGAYEPGQDAPVLVSTTLDGDPHEFGALLASVAAAEAGWRVLYLGPSLPAEEIAGAALNAGASVVAVSVVDARPESDLLRDLRALRGQLPLETRVLVGGRTAAAHAEALAGIAGVEHGDLELLRRVLPSGTEAVA